MGFPDNSAYFPDDVLDSAYLNACRLVKYRLAARSARAKRWVARRRHPYIMIKRVWETRTVGNNQSLFVSTGSDVYTIKSAFFPDLETYATVRDFLQTLATES